MSEENVKKNVEKNGLKKALPDENLERITGGSFQLACKFYPNNIVEMHINEGRQNTCISREPKPNLPDPDYEKFCSACKHSFVDFKF